MQGGAKLPDYNMTCKRASSCKLQGSPQAQLPCFYWAQYRPTSSALQTRMSPFCPVSLGAVRCTATLQAPTSLLPQLR